MIENKHILLVECHPDDYDLALGGFISRLGRNNPNNIEAICFSSADNVNGQKIEDEFWQVMRDYGITLRTTLYQDIPTMEFYKFENMIKKRLHYCREHFKPDVVISTSPYSDNLDHQILGKCVLNVFQEQSVLFYEDIRGGREHKPDIYIRLTTEEFMAKLRVLSYYKTQVKRKYFQPDAVSSMALFRGSQIGETYAESLQIARLVI